MSEEQAREYFEKTGAENPTRYSVGVDLGQASDPTAIAVGEYNPRHPPPRLVRVRHLERIPLGTSYPVIVEYLANMLRAKPLTRANSTLTVDATGVGRAVLDMLETAGLRPIGVTFTGSGIPTEVEPRRWRVSKADLVGEVTSGLATETLKISPGCHDAAALRSELESFEIRATTRSETFGAESGKHDDLICAVMLTLWTANRHSPVRVL